MGIFFELISKGWLALMSKQFIRLILFGLTCLTLGVAVFLLYMINPSNSPLPLSCSFYRFTGLYCPGCGMTRALYYAIHGRFIFAFSYNLLWPFIIFFVALVIYLWLRYLYTGKNPLNPVNSFLQRHSFSGWFVLILILSFWLLRNIPIYPLTLLAPG